MKKVRALPLHDEGGGELQVTELQGSDRHAPALQPKEHAMSVKVYVHPEAVHVPGDVYRRWTFPMQTESGGVRHPWHTSPMQVPALQPLVQTMSTGLYSQRPMAQVPGDRKAVRVLTLQVAAGGEVQAVHVAPAMPQRSSVWAEVRTHWPLALQQPVGHDAASQTQTPPAQRWPWAQARPLPHAQSPLRSQASAVTPHGAQAWPRAPHAFLSGVWQVLPTQHPAVQVCAQPLQLPFTHASLDGQRVHAWPRAPQAEASVPVTHDHPSQQPVGQDPAVHATAPSGGPPASLPPPPVAPPAPPPPAPAPPPPPAPPTPPPVAGTQERRHSPSGHNPMPSGHPSSSSGLKAVSFEGSTHTHDVTVAAIRTRTR